jgi:hypothetical protein
VDQDETALAFIPLAIWEKKESSSPMIDNLGQSCRAKVNLLVLEEDEAVMAEIAKR